MNQKYKGLSAIILARNEQDRIAACLNAVRFTDEQIVIDTGSTDRTAKIAESLGANVVSCESRDFSRLREFGREHARGEWLLYVDADEIVTEALSHEIKKTIHAFEDGMSLPVAYFIRRQNCYLGQRWPYVDRMERLFWRRTLRAWRGSLHETPVVDGVVSELSEPMIHHTHRTLGEMVAKTNEWSDVEARLRLEHRHPDVVWWRLFRVMGTGFLDSFVRQGGWRIGAVGWIESIYQAFSMFITYAKLWELQQKSGK